MIPILSALFVSAQISVALADSVPTLDVMPSCRATAAGVAGIKQDVSVCLDDENRARDALVKQWGQFAAADRSSCSSLSQTGGTATYTELLTCLEMMTEARKLPKEDMAGVR